MQIFVGSLNPVKINAVTQAASETWPTVQVSGMDVPSGIPEQPWGDEQTRQGARNRAVAALEDGMRESGEVAEQLGVGLEGGVMEFDGQVWSTVWAVVVDDQGNFYESNGARFPIPEPIATRLREGGELGPLFSKVAGESNLKHGRGAIGVITKNFIDRTEEYTVIAKMALGLWYGRDWAAALR